MVKKRTFFRSFNFGRFIEFAEYSLVNPIKLLENHKTAYFRHTDVPLRTRSSLAPLGLLLPLVVDMKKASTELILARLR